jgi:hypothetical protein
MKKVILRKAISPTYRTLALPLLAIVVVGFFAGCATKEVVFGAPTEIQRVLNDLLSQFPVKIAGKELKVELRGDYWLAYVDGKENMAGTFDAVDNADGSTFTLKQTHTYSDKENPITKKPVGWVKASTGLKIALDYKKGPPASISVK